MPLTASLKLYIFGASGTGSTTLGKAIASDLDLTHVDTDDHYWAPVEPPFSIKREPLERVASMKVALGGEGWVISGACNGWGSDLIDLADLIVFISVPTPVRIQRLRAREKARFGDRIEDGGDMSQIHQDFIQWAKGYDTPEFQGRNLAAHEKWLEQQVRPVCRIDGQQPLGDVMETIISKIHSL